MAGLLDIFGTGGTQTLGLLGGDIGAARDDAQAQALYALAGSLLSGGPTGLSIVKGLQQGQQAYKQAMQSQLQDQLQSFQLQDALRKRKLEEEALKRKQMIDAAIASQYQPAQAAQPAQEIYGEDIMGQRVGQGMTEAVPSRPASLNLQALVPALMTSEEGRAALSNLSKVIPEARKAGLMGSQQQENPFAMFATDPAVPAPLRAVAQQYQKSYAAGQIDQETADKRLAELASRVQSAQQFAQTQAGLEQNRALMGGIAQQQLALRQQAEESKPEQFSYSQKKDFDLIQGYKDEAKKAAANASIAGRAIPLIEQAYSGVIEAGAKGLVGAIGYETAAKTANDRLAQMSNQLAVNAPHFSGPTSDKDAARYDEAVGDLKNPRKSVEAKKAALKDIQNLSRKAEQYSTQAENYFYQNNKSLRGFKFNENPYDGM